MENKNLLKQTQKNVQIQMHEEKVKNETVTQTPAELQQQSSRQYLLQKHGEKAAGMGFDALDAQPADAMAEYANQKSLQNLSGAAGRLAAQILNGGELPEAEVLELQKQEALLKEETKGGNMPS